MTKHRIPSIEKSSGNVYSDLGYADSNAMLITAQLVGKIAEIISTRKLTQAEAASKLGLTQPKVAALLKGQFRGVSERRLLDCLTRLGRDSRL
jgi:predicted XRE-type DNA-binding protein